MHIEKKNQRGYQLSISGYELATLISSARWAAEGGNGELTQEAKNQLILVLADFNKAFKEIAANDSVHSR